MGLLQGFALRNDKSLLRYARNDKRLLRYARNDETLQ